jgi:chitodextrinase
MGFIQTSSTRPYIFEYPDGTPWFHFGDTNWSAMFDQVGFEDRFKPYVDLRTSQHFNLIMVFLVTSAGDYHNEGGWVFNSGWNNLNPGFFQWMDPRVAYANEKGMVIVIQPAWPDVMASVSSEQYKRFIRYLVARYAAYEVFWNVSGEYEESQLPNSRITEYGQTFANYDPYDHPRSVHTLFSSRAFGNEAWHSYIMQQIFHYQNQEIINDRIFDKPVVNSEYGYLYGLEGPGSSNDHVRKKAWEIAVAGGFFQAGFINTFYVTRGGWHLNDSNDNLVIAQLGYLYNFFTQKSHWWEMDPNNNLGSGSTNFVLADEGSEYIVYMEEGGTTDVDLTDASGSLMVEWLNPRTGEYMSDNPIPGGSVQPFTAPGSYDWVLHISTSAFMDSTPPSVPQSLDADPISENRIDLAWQASSDPESGIYRYKIYRNDVNVGQTSSTSYSDMNLQENTTYSYQVSAVNGAGLESAKSSPAVATTFSDLTPPTILSAMAPNATQVDVKFSEPVEQASSEDESNYFIDQGISVFNAALDADLQTVHLTTSEHIEEITYMITINDVRDRASVPNVIAPNSTASYQLILELEVSNLNKGNYETAMLTEGDQYYVDRNYTITDIPAEYEGLLWIKTANDDKYNTSEEFLTFTVNQDVTAYIAYDHRATSLPEWITTYYAGTGAEIAVSDVEASPLHVWSRDFPAGDVVMGGNMATGASGAYSMYAVLLRGQGMSADTTAPLISGVLATGVSEDQVTIQWSTDEISNSQVEYGLTAAYGSTTPLDENLVTQHLLTLSDLSPATLYHYRVRSADGSANVAYSGDHTFETTGADVIPPQIFSVEVSTISDSGATITWSTDESSDSKVEYGLAPDVYNWSVEDTSLTMSHSLDIMELSPMTQYHFSVQSRDASGNVSATADSMFITTQEVPGQPSKPIHYDD